MTTTQRSRPTRAAWPPPTLTGLLVVALMLPASATQAQPGADRMRVSPGDSLRIRLSGRMTVQAAFDSWGPHAVLLDLPGVGPPWPIPFEELERLDAYLIRTPSESFRHGAAMGAAAGLFIGAGLGLLLHATGVASDSDDPPETIITRALQGAGLGIVGGVVVGGAYARSHPTSGWIRIELPAS